MTQSIDDKLDQISSDLKSLREDVDTILLILKSRNEFIKRNEAMLQNITGIFHTKSQELQSTLESLYISEDEYPMITKAENPFE